MPDPQEQVDPTHLTAEQLERLRATFNANLDPQPGRTVEPRRWDWVLTMPEVQDWQREAQAAPPVPDLPAPQDVPTVPVEPPPRMTAAEVLGRPGGRRTRRDQNAPTQAPPPVQRGYRTPLTRAANLTQQRIPIQVDAFTGAEFRDNSLWITADFIEGGARVPLHFGIYADTGRALAPYVQEALKRIAEILRDINNLPEPRRREIPNATVGERMFNMIQLLMDKAEVSEQVQNEWQVLALEYERHVGGGGLQ